jgi:hypothetical protein
MSKVRRSNQQLADRAAPVRAMLQKLIHRKVKTKAEREALAKFLGQAVSSVNGMIYEGLGGLDSWIGALIFCYKIEPKMVEKFFDEMDHFLRKSRPSSKADKLYLELSESLPEDDIVFLLGLIGASIKLGRRSD